MAKTGPETLLLTPSTTPPEPLLHALFIIIAAIFILAVEMYDTNDKYLDPLSQQFMYVVLQPIGEGYTGHVQ